MKNITKIGLSALAGALAMTSANAGAMSLSGSMEATWTTGSGYSTIGQPFGMDKELTIKGSTELDNGTAVNYKQTVTDAFGFNDSEIAFVTDLGTITLGSAGNAIGGIDDVTPTAFEEANALLGSIDDVNGADGDFGIRYTLADVAGSGFTFDAFYTGQHGSGDAHADNGTSGAKAQDNGAAWEAVVKGSVPGVDGLSVGVGYSLLEERDPSTTTVKQSSTDQDEGTAYATYAYGPLKFGYQIGAVNTGANVLYKNQYYGVSYAVSDDLSISYNWIDASKTATDGLRTEQDFDSVSASYSMGGMTINVADSDCSNCSYSAARSRDATTVSLAIAF
jgi:hypothetical protein